MIPLRFLLVVALAFTAYAGQDLELAYKLSECLRKATIEGIPSINLPSHNPLRINKDLSWNGDIGIASATLNVSNIVWYGIPDWHASIEQLSQDNESIAIFNYHLFWNRFVLTSDYSLDTRVGLVPVNTNGDLNVTVDGSYWKGSVNFSKPGNLTEEINDLDLIWTAEAVDFNFTGLALLDEPISSSFSKLVKSYLDSGAMKNVLGEALKERLNTAWFAKPDRIDTVLKFCKDN